MKRPPNLALCLAVALSACSFSQENHGYLASGADTLVGGAIGGGASEDKKASAKAAPVLVTPAPAGALTEKPYANGWRQSMSLDGRKIAGDWNDLTIDIKFESASLRAGAKIPIAPPTQDGIHKEILARFPGTPMHVVGRPMSNSLGPFGLAVGAEADVRCAFAWQWVDDIRARPGEFRSWFQEKTPASIRLRLCRSGVTADELASLFEQLETTDNGALDRVVAMWKKTLDSTLASSVANNEGGVNSALIGPVVVDPTLEASLVEASARTIKVVRPNKETKAETKGVPSTENTKAATKIVPPTEKTKAASAVGPPRRRLARRTQAGHAEHVVQTAPISVSSRGGRQYLAPTDAQTRRSGGPANGGADSGLAGLDPGLPAQAYLGPLPQSRPRPAAGASGEPPRYLGATGPAQ